MKCGDDTKLTGDEDTLEGKDAHQENLERIQLWANKNFVNFSKDKEKVFSLGKHNLKVQHRLESIQM